jgi:hypothetical protein
MSGSGLVELFLDARGLGKERVDSWFKSHRCRRGTIKGGMSEVVCFRLQAEGPLSFAQEFGFDPAEISQLAPLYFVARNMDSGGELRGQIKV